MGGTPSGSLASFSCRFVDPDFGSIVSKSISSIDKAVGSPNSKTCKVGHELMERLTKRGVWKMEIRSTLVKELMDKFSNAPQKLTEKDLKDMGNSIPWMRREVSIA